MFKYSTVCTTIETNRFYKDVMQCSPKIEDRVKAMEDIADLDIDTYVTVEPIMDFDLDEMVDFIRRWKTRIKYQALLMNYRVLRMCISKTI